MVSCDTCWCTWIKSVHCLVHVVSMGLIFCSPHLEVRAPGSTRTHQEKIHPPTHSPTYPLLPRHPGTQHPQPPIPSIFTPAKKNEPKNKKHFTENQRTPVRLSASKLCLQKVSHAHLLGTLDPSALIQTSLALRVNHTTVAMEVLPADSSTLVGCEPWWAWRVIGLSAAPARCAGRGVCNCVCVDVCDCLVALPVVRF